jgi:hypothetical protein
MKKVRIVVTALILLAACRAYGYQDGDFQIWNTDAQEVKIRKGVKFAMEEEFRFGDSASELYYQHYEWGLVFGFARMLDLGFFYRLIYEKDKHKWREEDMPHADATLKSGLWKFKLQDRNRIEYKHYRYKDDFIRYRNKFTLKLPLDFAKLKIAPYVSDEIFVVSTGDGFNENRFFTGAELELTKYVKADIYYLLKSKLVSGDKWKDANVLGGKLKIAF